MDTQELRKRQKLKDSLPYYSEHCLKIRTKSGDIKPFIHNKAQSHLHRETEDQLQKKGFVRVIIVKGRQQGCSTYVSGRYFHKTTHNKGTRTFILTQAEKATGNLFDLVLRYLENLPKAVKPSTGKKNASGIMFDKLDSSYALGTAASGDVGRSDTIQLLHGSEVAFWEKAEEIQTGIMQTVADIAGTEIILESTANGESGMFYNLTMDALKGLNYYKVVFIPWYWQEEYVLPVDETFERTPQEDKLVEMYGLKDEQLSWRRNKISNLKSEIMFKQEYPFTVNEAFQSTGENRMFDPEAIREAMEKPLREVNPKISQLIVGVDPALSGDHTAICYRDGNQVIKTEKLPHCTSTEVVGKIVNIIKIHKPYKVNIDTTGLGICIYESLVELGWGDVVKSVIFGATKTVEEPNKYFNKRAEMYGRASEWINTGNATIIKNDALEADLKATSYKVRSGGMLQLPLKDDIKKETGRSPDDGDAFVLTFAFNYPSVTLQDRYHREIEVVKDYDIFNPYK